MLDILTTAFILADAEDTPEIGVGHLLAALDVHPSNTTGPTESRESLVPVPKWDKALSSQAKAAIAAISVEHLTVDSFRSALLAARRS